MDGGWLVMEYLTLGRSGLRVSRIGLGCWQFGDRGWGWGITVTEADALAVLEAAFDAGINFIDTAEVYGNGVSEEVIGRFVKKVGRDNLVIASKVSGQHLRYGDVLRAAEGSLSRLGVSAIDLYQVHWPNPYVPLGHTMRAMEELVRRGVVRYIGVSNFPKPLLMAAQESLSRYEIVSNQVRYNLLQREVEEEILPYCRSQGMAIIAYSPLAQGLLTGKFERPELAEQDLRRNNVLFHPANMDRVARFIRLLREVAQRYNRSPSQVALNWLLTQKDVFPIPGAKRPDQVLDNVGAVGWRLGEEDVQLLSRASGEVEISYFV